MSLNIHSQQNDALIEYYTDRDNCISEIQTARKTFTDKQTTEEQYDAMEKALGIMLLYCPDGLRGAVEATLFEAEYRRLYFPWA
jgi:hypothetical protein